MADNICHTKNKRFSSLDAYALFIALVLADDVWKPATPKERKKKVEKKMDLKDEEGGTVKRVLMKKWTYKKIKNPRFYYGLSKFEIE